VTTGSSQHPLQLLDALRDLLLDRSPLRKDLERGKMLNRLRHQLLGAVAAEVFA
jgi:hypothetical protein